MANDTATATTSPETAPEETGAPIAKQPGFWDKLATVFSLPKKTGVHCTYCEWWGTKDQVVKAPRLNEDGKVYQIDACPNCMRNGGLEFYD